MTGALNFARISHALVLLQDGRVMAIGGFNPATNAVTWEGTDPEATTWVHLGGQRMDVPYLGQGRWNVSELPSGMYLLGMENDGVPVYRRLSVP